MILISEMGNIDDVVPAIKDLFSGASVQPTHGLGQALINKHMLESCHASKSGSDAFTKGGFTL